MNRDTTAGDIVRKVKEVSNVMKKIMEVASDSVDPSNLKNEHNQLFLALM
jgi:hypothetical protein